MKMNVDYEARTINGINVKVIPETGYACRTYIGSDIRGFQIGYVSPDKTWFQLLRKSYSNGMSTKSEPEMKHYGFAALITRKNSPGRGLYTIAIEKNGKKIPASIDTKHARMSSYGVYYISEEIGCPDDYDDPSF